MIEQSRILIVGRQRETMDRVVRILENVGCIVTGTLNDGVAIDLAGSSDYDALLIGDDLSRSDRRYVTTQARNRRPSIAVIALNSPDSVLTQLRHAGIKL